MGPPIAYVSQLLPDLKPSEIYSNHSYLAQGHARSYRRPEEICATAPQNTANSPRKLYNTCS